MNIVNRHVDSAREHMIVELEIIITGLIRANVEKLKKKKNHINELLNANNDGHE